MKFFDEVSEIARIVTEKFGPLDRSALKVSIDRQVPDDSTDLVLRHRGHVVLVLSGVDKIAVPVFQSTAERPLEGFPASSLLEIQLVPRKP